MTITKEDQMRAEFELLREEFESAHEDWKFADTKALWFWFYKTCAESYEKKLAEKDENHRFVDCEYFNMQKQLSEANARNAMLVDAIQKALNIYDEADDTSDKASDVWQIVNEIEVVLFKASTTCQATAEAYEREVQWSALEYLMMNWNYSIGNEDNITRRMEELHAANRGKEEL